MSGGSKKSSGRRTAGMGEPASTVGPNGGSGGGGGPGGSSGPNCNLHYEAELAGVRADAASLLRMGDTLDVILHRSGEYEAVACRTQPPGEIVGTLANVEGLDELLGCLRTNHRYVAVVIQVGRHLCHVVIDPARP